MSSLSFVPAKWRFETTLALRHLTSGGGQTLLTMGAAKLVPSTCL